MVVEIKGLGYLTWQTGPASLHPSRVPPEMRNLARAIATSLIIEEGLVELMCHLMPEQPFPVQGYEIIETQATPRGITQDVSSDLDEPQVPLVWRPVLKSIVGRLGLDAFVVTVSPEHPECVMITLMLSQSCYVTTPHDEWLVRVAEAWEAGMII